MVLSKMMSDQSNCSLNTELLTSVDECSVPVKTTVRGSIPEWLQGSLLRIGPAKFEWGETQYRHWFDGDGLLHRFDINNGEVKYSSKFVRSNSYMCSKAKGRITHNQFATVAPPDPCQNIFARMISQFIPVLPSSHGNTNVNIVELKKEYYAVTETPVIHKIDVETLDTLERVDLTPKLGVMRGLLAHPHTEDNGTYINMSVNWSKGVYDIIKIPPQSDVDDVLAGMEIISQISFNWKPSYYHSFGMTPNYFVLFNNPLAIPNTALFMLKDFIRISFKEMFQWDKDGRTKIIIIERKSGRVVQRAFTEKLFIFHHVNAFENEDEIIVDVIGYNDASIIDSLYLHALRNQTDPLEEQFSPPSLRRYRIRLACSSEESEASVIESLGLPSVIGHEVLCKNVELPNINYKAYNGKKYKFVYCVNTEGIFAKQDLVKINVQTKEKYQWSEELCYASEPVFVGRPDSLEEDDGVVLSAVVGLQGKQSFLLILDAKSFREVARATVPLRLASSLHGIFVHNG